MIVLMAGQTICVALNCDKAHPTSVICKSQEKKPIDKPTK